MNYYTYEGNLKDRNRFTSTVNTPFGTKRYFSSLDTEIYFGSKQIEEIMSIDFTVSEPKLPIYGFNSFYPNRIISGRRTVQGTFAINFTHTISMIKILREIEDSIFASKYENISSRCPVEDTTGLGIGNSPIFEKIFDITISYGYGKSATPSYNGCYQTLVGVQIVDYRQALDTDGNPILDMYSFIAKDIRYEIPESEVKEEGTEDTTTEEIEESTHIVANKYVEDEYNPLISKCTNTELDGFIVSPYFDYTISDKYYLKLGIDSMNNSTTTFTDSIVTLNNKVTGLNVSIPMGNVSKGSETSVEFKDSLRDAGIELYKCFSSGENDTIDCTIEFFATVENQKTKIKHKTILARLGN